jgi:hypothetical protein
VRRTIGKKTVARCELAQLLKGICLAPAQRAGRLDPSLEANFNSAADYLLGKFDGQTAVDLTKKLDTLDPAIRSMVEAFQESAAIVGFGIHAIMKLPCSDGYEPFLAKNGFNPVAARGVSNLITASARRQRTDLEWMGSVVGGIRLLAKPRQKAATTKGAIQLLLSAAESTTVFETIFQDDLDREREFIRLLEGALQEGRPSQRLTEIAASLTKTPALRRGPKTKASSIAHELLLREGVAANGSTAYTYSEINGDFTDDLTQATRREFNEPDFRPRAARNRIRRALRQ